MLVVGWQFIGQEWEWESTPLAKVLQTNSCRVHNYRRVHIGKRGFRNNYEPLSPNMPPPPPLSIPMGVVLIRTPPP